MKIARTWRRKRTPWSSCRTVRTTERTATRRYNAYRNWTKFSLTSLTNKNPRTRMGAIDNKIAIVTGAGGGIGGAIAKRFAREGAKLAVADIDADAGKSCVAA